jgi:hypothetical protein
MGIRGANIRFDARKSMQITLMIAEANKEICDACPRLFHCDGPRQGVMFMRDKVVRSISRAGQCATFPRDYSRRRQDGYHWSSVLNAIQQPSSTVSRARRERELSQPKSPCRPRKRQHTSICRNLLLQPCGAVGAVPRYLAESRDHGPAPLRADQRHSSATLTFATTI